MAADWTTRRPVAWCITALALCATGLATCSKSKDDDSQGSRRGGALVTPGGVAARFIARAGERIDGLEVVGAGGERWMRAERCFVTPSLESWLDGQAPARLELSGVAIRLGAETRFLSAIGAMFGAREATCSIRDATIELPAADPSAPAPPRAEGVGLTLDRVANGTSHVQFAASFGGTPARIEWMRTPDSLVVSCDAKGLALDAWQPLVSALFPGARAAGRGDAAFDLTVGPGPRFALSGNARLERFGLGDRAGGTIVADPLVTLAGRIECDLATKLVLLEKFRCQSSFVFVEGSGSLSPRGGALAGDLAAHAGIDFGRAAAFDAAPWTAALFRLGLSGNIDARVNPGEDGGIHLSASGDRVQAKLTGTDVLLGTELTISAELRVDDSLTAVLVPEFFGSFAFGDVTGSGAWNAAGAFDLKLEMESELRHLAGFLARVFGLPGLTAGGEAEIEVGIARTRERFTASAKVAGEDLGVRFDRSIPGGGELYVFEGAPLEVALELSAPGPDAPPQRWDGRIDAKSSHATIGVDRFDDFSLEASLSGGQVVMPRLDARFPEGGSLHAEGALAIAGADRGAANARISVRDVVPRLTLQEFAAAVAPVFAPAGGPPIVATDVKLTADVDVRGRGDTLGAIRGTLSGTGRAEFSAGAISGSPLLDALLPGPAGPRAVDPLAGEFTIEAGTLQIDPLRLGAGGRAFRFRGTTRMDGSLSFALDPVSLFDAAFVEKHGKSWPANLFGVRGTLAAPRVRVPNVEEWRGLAERGELDRAVREFDGP